MTERPSQLDSPEQVAADLDGEMRALTLRNTPNERKVRLKYSRLLSSASPEFVLDVARILVFDYGYRGDAYELIADHLQAFEHIGPAELQEFGQGINSWWSVDSFGRILSGPARLRGQISDALIVRWAHSDDRWWRRAALVSTVALNMRSQGGTGDAGRTLQICCLLVDDRDDMVVKAMSWALRALVWHDSGAVRQFLSQYNDRLAARVKREVRNKLTTGLKNPKQR